MTGTITAMSAPVVDQVAAKRWLVTGAHGMLGRDLVGHPHVLWRGCHGDRPREVDITDPAATLAAVDGHDLVVNAAAWTDVDGAETNEEVATRINGLGPTNLAAACGATGARLLHLSTDYVFAGNGSAPYREDAPTAPLNAYGRGKLVGEQAVLRLTPETGYVVRTAWLYGAGGNNFISTMLRLAGQREHIDVVPTSGASQPGPTRWRCGWSELGVAGSAGTAPAGIYHGTASGETTWFGLARAVFVEAGLDPKRIRPTTSDQLSARRCVPGTACSVTTGGQRPAWCIDRLAHDATRRLSLDQRTAPVCVGRTCRVHSR